MVNESKGLGRGLGALLGAELRVNTSRGGGRMPLSFMQPGAFQPRREIRQEPLEELAASIKASGVIQPIVVRPLPAGAVGDARYEIVAGERRWQAAKLAGLADIPVIVRELSDSQAVAVALIENIQREELTPAEEARALKRLIEEFQLTHEAVGKGVGRSRAAVSNLLRLLELPGDIIALIDAKKLSMGHARALLGLDDEAGAGAARAARRGAQLVGAGDGKSRAQGARGRGGRGGATQAIGGRERGVAHPASAGAAQAEGGWGCEDYRRSDGARGAGRRDRGNSRRRKTAVAAGSGRRHARRRPPLNGV